LCLVPDGSRRAAFVPNRRGTRHADGYGVLRLVGALDFLGAPSFANDRRNRTARAVPLLWEGCTGRLAPCRFCAEQARYTARRWLWSAPTCRSFGFPWDSERRERQAEPDGSRRAAFVGLDPWGRSSMPEDRGAGRVNAFRNRYRGVTMTRSDGSRGGAHVDGCESRF
jgi:hypothetical protein